MTENGKVNAKNVTYCHFLVHPGTFGRRLVFGNPPPPPILTVSIPLKTTLRRDSEVLRGRTDITPETV